MIRKERVLGYFVGTESTGDALFEIDGFQRTTGCEIKLLSVRKILEGE